MKENKYKIFFTVSVRTFVIPSITVPDPVPVPEPKLITVPVPTF
jgi:hypothetical protein